MKSWDWRGKNSVVQSRILYQIHVDVDRSCPDISTTLDLNDAIGSSRDDHAGIYHFEKHRRSNTDRSHSMLSERLPKGGCIRRNLMSKLELVDLAELQQRDCGTVCYVRLMLWTFEPGRPS